MNPFGFCNTVMHSHKALQINAEGPKMVGPDDLGVPATERHRTVEIEHSFVK